MCAGRAAPCLVLELHVGDRDRRRVVLEPDLFLFLWLQAQVQLMVGHRARFADHQLPS